ncbi:MAG: YdiU family protein [Comamonas sp.]
MHPLPVSSTTPPLPPNAEARPARGDALTTALPWLNRYRALGPAFFSEPPLQPLPRPHWVARNPWLLNELGLPADWLDGPDALAVFSGNQTLHDDAPAIATVYSGHQFGVWAGQLGDGRAVLLGEADTALGPMEFQLKGAGPTPYSRMGDGRAVLRSSIREFLASEAMHALGVPTTRALCLAASPQPVRREEIETAAVVTRLAPSFIRFGHFEHFAHHGLHAELRQLADFTLAHHFPDCAGHANPYASLLGEIAVRTARLIAHWQAVGFCHGVMNTDNMSVLGLTIDYGPFQFLDGFDPTHICNHSDHQGRYAYHRQPNVALWNLYALGQALLPLIEDSDATLAALERYRAEFPAAFRQQMGRKLGLPDLSAEQEREVLEPLLKLLARERTDYPIFWRRLADGPPGTPGFEAVVDLFTDREAVRAWGQAYARLAAGHDPDALRAALRQANPRFVLRNHLAEQAIRAAEQGDFGPTQDLLAVLQAPFDEHPGQEALADFPPDWAAGITISCSS